MKRAILTTAFGLILTSAGIKAWADESTQQCYDHHAVCPGYTCYPVQSGTCTDSNGVIHAYNTITNGLLVLGACIEGGSGCPSNSYTCFTAYYFTNAMNPNCIPKTLQCKLKSPTVYTGC